MPKPAPSTAEAGEDVTTQARRRIIDAALEVFLRDGYVGAKTDEIAAMAGASKQTIYKHFGRKENLFEQIVLDRLGGIDEIFQAAIGELAATTDVESTLTTVARKFLATIMQPSHLRVRRLVIAEAGRFPHLGHAYFQAGPERVHAALASAFGQLADRSLLRIDEPALAANHFTWLVVSIPVNKVMFCGDDTHFTQAELDHYADAAVRVFTAAYGTATGTATGPATGTATGSASDQRSA